ncbi:MAG: hypothetical protein M1536_05535 [Firmicutes bacterium]|nr:hypothetical protein [Bacillota bacterium]
MGLLSIKATQYKVAILEKNFSIARTLAEAGLEEARVKINKDLNFPPEVAEQSIYSYTEEVVNSDGERIGVYQVSVDMSKDKSPDYYIIITSTGIVGTTDPSDNPLAIRSISARIDTASKERSNPLNDNGYYFRVIDYQDGGSL